MDKGDNQTPEKSYLHAMYGKKLNRTDAINDAIYFVKANMQRAKWFNEHGQRQAALWSFGLALHTVQDSTSPAHHGFQIWDCASWDVICNANHAKKELILPSGSLGSSNLARSTNTMMYYFNVKYVPSFNVFNIFGAD